LTPGQMEIKDRLMLCVSVLLQNPLKQDTEIVNFLMSGCGGICEAISQSQAYRDVAALRKMVGSIQLSSKAWYRYTIIEGSKVGYELAVAKKDPKGIASNLKNIGTFTRADKDDDTIDWSEMIQPSMEPTDDVSVLNLDPIDNLEQERAAFRALFKKNLKDKAEDV
jgi:hypothetical protein